MTPKIIIPTRNRPRQMQDFLDFLAKFYPGQSIVVLDGSQSAEQSEVAQICEGASSALDVTFKPYPTDLPLFERLLDGVQSVPDEILAVAADDDFPIMDTYAAAADMLAQNPDLSTVVPYDIVLTLSEQQTLSARLSVSRSVRHPTAAKRVDGFARWRFATSYGAIRKSTLIARYQALSKVYCAGFIDYQIGIEDCLEGGIAALPQLGCMRTHTYTASYLRPSDKLVFLRRSEEVLAIVDHTAARLQQVDGLSAEHAASIASTAMVRQVGSLVGAGAFAKTEFLSSPTFLKRDVQEQFEQFYQMFEDGTALRAKYFEQLSFVTKCLIAQTKAALTTAALTEGYQNYEVL